MKKYILFVIVMWCVFSAFTLKMQEITGYLVNAKTNSVLQSDQNGRENSIVTLSNKTGENNQKLALRNFIGY